ncbi:MAG: family 20 glycosylhydrolase, partial [Candidatus Aminicenantes bacterium]|nr:family 20 glycosylhydrolase [Candidatus Aminicenantes bacterium]
FAAKLLNQEIENLIKTPLEVKAAQSFSNFKNTIILAIPERDREFLNIFKWQDTLGDKRLSEEGYIIDVDVKDEYILIAARTEAGLFYGIQTLRQLLKNKKNKIIVPSLWIRDWPEIRCRGVMQDISRGQVLTIDTFKELIRTLSYFKINLLSLYIEHTFVFQKHPLISQGCGSLTKEEVKELDEYAKNYHIELVPSFQALGHFHQILRHKEYAHLAETETRWSLSPAREESYKFLEELFSEIIPAFSSRFFNIGCDEVYDLGEGKSKEKAKELGKGGLYLSHILKVKEIIDKYGKTTMLWGDMLLHHPEIISHNQGKATKNKKWLDDILFAAQEIGYLGKRVLLIEEIKNLYHQAYRNLGEEKVVTECLKKILTLLNKLKSDLLGLKEKYQSLWLRENREPGLDYNLERYTSLIKSFDRKIS